MERLPEEIRELIFDYVLRDDPDTLFSLRCISKDWKIFVDEYVSRFPEWYNACKQEIPKRCFNDIVEKIAPLSAYPWQDSFWMRSRWSDVPKEVYQAWKNLPSLMLKNFQITKFRQDDFIPIASRTSSFIEDKYIVIPFEARNEIKTHVFDIQNLSAPIRTFDGYFFDNNELNSVDFFTDINGKCRISVQLNRDLYLADFLTNNELSSSGVHLGDNEEWLVVKNEGFTIDNDLLAITHYKFTDSRFQPSEKITLPSIPDSVIDSIHISGAELQILVLTKRVRGSNPLRIYRYKISGDSSGKLSFTKDKNNFVEEIRCNLSPNVSNSRAGNSDLFTVARIFYIKSASLLFIDNDKLFETVNGYASRGLFINDGTLRIWETRADEITSMDYHANYLVLGTMRGLIIIYQMKNIDDILESVKANATPPKCNVINLKASEIRSVRIAYVGLKLRIIADEFWTTFIIDFPGED